MDNKLKIRTIIGIGIIIQLVITIITNKLFFKKVSWFREMLMFMFLILLLRSIIKEIQKFIALLIKFSNDYNMFDAIKYSIDNLIHNRTVQNAMTPEELKQEWEKK